MRGIKKPVEVFGIRYQSMASACRSLGFNQPTVERRIAKGLSTDDAFSPESDAQRVPNKKSGDQVCDHVYQYIDWRAE